MKQEMQRPKGPMRRGISDQVTARVLDGRLPADARINESRLSQELGVSRTPLREALVELADRGLLSTEGGSGFRVPALDLTEARRLYPLVGELEALALRWSSPQDLLGLIGQLERGNDRMQVALDRGEDLAGRDDEWHARLLSACTNSHLLHLIAQTKPLLKRYDVMYFGDLDRARRSIEEHRQIMTAIGEGDLFAAARWLTRNWVNGGACLGRLPGQS